MAAFLQLNKLRKNWRSVTVTTALSWLMKLAMAGLVPFEIHRGNVLFALAILLAVALSLIPSIVQRNYNITLPFELDLLITLSIFLHTFLGEGLDLYRKVFIFDKVLHFFGGAVVAILGFVIVYSLHYTRKVRLTIPLIGFFTVIFSLAMGGLWEIGEFAVDSLFGKETQNGLADTMWDMVYDLIGGILAAILGMIYVRYSKPDARKRLARPIGDVFGIGRKIDGVKEAFREIRAERIKKRRRL